MFGTDVSREFRFKVIRLSVINLIIFLLYLPLLLCSSLFEQCCFNILGVEYLIKLPFYFLVSYVELRVCFHMILLGIFCSGFIAGNYDVKPTR